MVTLSGVAAQEHGPQLITWVDNVSRLDCQLTVQEPDLSIKWATYVDKLAAIHPAVQSGSMETRFITSRPRGETSYIGSPGSDRMMRCYDKHAESDASYPPGTWRFEVQWRHKRANLVALRLLDKSCNPQSCLEAVCGAYRDYAIDLPVLCIPRGWRDAGVRTLTDTQRQLAWLEQSISPCVARLVDGVGLETVMKALKLDAVFDTMEGQAEEIRQLCNSLDVQLATPAPPSVPVMVLQ
jgi:DNA relaxase NicK